MRTPVHKDSAIVPDSEPSTLAVSPTSEGESAGLWDLTAEEKADEAVRQQVLAHVWDRLTKAPQDRRRYFIGIYHAIWRARPEVIQQKLDKARLERARR